MPLQIYSREILPMCNPRNQPGPRNHSGATDDIPGVAWRVAKTVEILSGMVILVFLDDFLSKVKVVAFGLPHFGSKVSWNQ